ncbi:hypothetical protein Lfu02_17680 [Longispora fulva]|uniref:Uncharacterized protein n=1 Tax=Longispora fulva TaxID=619741 RepID=A0A8J7GN99_9ACTN|nr:hypothetical protein [Longispora fulva]MBG6140227.1 hypothetical protein [Longispora fulva]GIG57396.1 hypothetical protein Lfu02_17680 [Longispora fulva]
MPAFDYIGPDERHYPGLSVTARPGDTAVELPDDPGDGRWIPTPPEEEATRTRAATKPKPDTPKEV